MDLIRDRALIGGQWLTANRGATFDSRSPADGRLIGSVPDMGADEAAAAVTAAHAAFPAWAARTGKDRAAVLRRWYDLLLEHTEELAQLMTAEQGKPLAESRGEVTYGASFIEWFAEEGKRVNGETIPTFAPDKRIVVLRQPVGVAAMITPWNFPIAMITRKVAPAVAVGCTVVVKPAQDTPLCALAIAALAEDAGLPPGVLNVVTADAPAEVGGVLTGDPRVRALSFTGSTDVGKLLMGQSADTVKKVGLELGGNAPFIVFDDADVDAAVEGAMVSKYRNGGQTCVCANRLLVQDGIHDTFVARLRDAVADLVVGPGDADGVTIGPLINEQGVVKVERLVSDAVGAGAEVVAGGSRHELGGSFYQPTVLTGVTTDMTISSEEIFGPVAPVFRFSTEDEAVRLANATPFGLAAYFYSRDNGRIWRVAEGLDYGMVGINTGAISSEVVPFGGVKESGVGREGGHQGMDEYLEDKYLCIGGIDQ
ncbi:MAG: NAD-dependent succinate-semialdehyde dehydrogenase [Actinomycetia bacterium]|nr:NAD-dependent succinate-semialdehyde dehydrogenase [Actinomycetes bacterium]